MASFGSKSPTSLYTTTWAFERVEAVAACGRRSPRTRRAHWGRAPESSEAAPASVMSSALKSLWFLRLELDALRLQVFDGVVPEAAGVTAGATGAGGRGREPARRRAAGRRRCDRIRRRRGGEEPVGGRLPGYRRWRSVAPGPGQRARVMAREATGLPMRWAPAKTVTPIRPATSTPEERHGRRGRSRSSASVLPSGASPAVQRPTVTTGQRRE